MTTALEAWSADLARRSAPMVSAVIEALVADQPDDSIVGIGMYTDADATSAVVVANTRAHHDALVEQTPRYPRYFRWSTGEWDLVSIDTLPDGAEGLDPLVDELERVADAVEDGELGTSSAADFREAAWSALASALAELAAEGFFERWPHAIVVFEPVDAAVTDDQRRAWIRAINAPEAAAAHAAWLGAPSS